jgi:hypothetical protein
MTYNIPKSTRLAHSHLLLQPAKTPQFGTLEVSHKYVIIVFVLSDEQLACRARHPRPTPVFLRIHHSCRWGVLGQTGAVVLPHRTLLHCRSLSRWKPWKIAQLLLLYSGDGYGLEASKRPWSAWSHGSPGCFRKFATRSALAHSPCRSSATHTSRLGPEVESSFVSQIVPAQPAENMVERCCRLLR